MSRRNNSFHAGQYQRYPSPTPPPLVQNQNRGSNDQKSTQLPQHSLANRIYQQALEEEFQDKIQKSVESVQFNKGNFLRSRLPNEKNIQNQGQFINQSQNLNTGSKQLTNSSSILTLNTIVNQSQSVNPSERQYSQDKKYSSDKKNFYDRQSGVDLNRLSDLQQPSQIYLFQQNNPFNGNQAPPAVRMKNSYSIDKSSSVMNSKSNLPSLIPKVQIRDRSETRKRIISSNNFSFSIEDQLIPGQPSPSKLMKQQKQYQNINDESSTYLDTDISRNNLKTEGSISYNQERNDILNYAQIRMKTQPSHNNYNQNGISSSNNYNNEQNYISSVILQQNENKKLLQNKQNNKFKKIDNNDIQYKSDRKDSKQIRQNQDRIRSVSVMSEQKQQQNDEYDNLQQKNKKEIYPTMRKKSSIIEEEGDEDRLNKSVQMGSLMVFNNQNNQDNSRFIQGGESIQLSKQSIIMPKNQLSNYNFSKKNITDKNYQEHMQLLENKQPFVDDYLTPKDFIQLIRTDAEMKDEFCYLNQITLNSYDWQIVPYAKRNPTNYMTISSRGIIQFYENEVKFMKLEEWEREYELYQNIVGISFFKTFRVWKNFFLWKRLMRRNIMKECSKILEYKLLILDPVMRESLIKVRGECLEMKKATFFDVKFSEPCKFDQFQIKAENFRKTSLNYYVNARQSTIMNIIQAACSFSLQKFKRDFRIPNKDDDISEIQNFQNIKQKAGMLIGDSEQREMPFAAEATLKIHQKKLKCFTKCIDYIILESKLQLVQIATDHLATKIENFNQYLEDDNFNMIEHISWIYCIASENVGKLSLYPSEEECKHEFDEIVRASIQDLINDHIQFSLRGEILEYLQSKDLDFIELAQEKINLSYLIYQDELFINHLKRLKNAIDISYKHIYKQSLTLVKPLEIYQEHLNINTNIYHDMDSDQFTECIEKYQKDDSFLSSLKVVEEQGLFYFDITPFKEVLKNSAQSSQKCLFDKLPTITIMRAYEFNKTTDSYLDMVVKNPSNLDQFVSFLKNYKVN